VILPSVLLQGFCAEPTYQPLAIWFHLSYMRLNQAERKASQIRAPRCPSRAAIVEPSSANKDQGFPAQVISLSPGLLLGHQALQELRPIFLVGLHTLR
jgi:hypothetical protein